MKLGERNAKTKSARVCVERTGEDERVPTGCTNKSATDRHTVGDPHKNETRHAHGKSFQMIADAGETIDKMAEKARAGAENVMFRERRRGRRCGNVQKRACAMERREIETRAGERHTEKVNASRKELREKIQKSKRRAYGAKRKSRFGSAHCMEVGRWRATLG